MARSSRLRQTSDDFVQYTVRKPIKGAEGVQQLQTGQLLAFQFEIEFFFHRQRNGSIGNIAISLQKLPPIHAK